MALLVQLVLIFTFTKNFGIHGAAIANKWHQDKNDLIGSLYLYLWGY